MQVNLTAEEILHLASDTETNIDIINEQIENLSGVEHEFLEKRLRIIKSIHRKMESALKK
jgi:hypothetical protein